MASFKTYFGIIASIPYFYLKSPHIVFFPANGFPIIASFKGKYEGNSGTGNFGTLGYYLSMTTVNISPKISLLLIDLG